MDWIDYVRETARDDTQTVIAERTGIDQTTISRWYSGQRTSITPRSVTLFARGYGKPVLAAFVHAGLISPEDAKVRVVHMPLTKVTTQQLVAELARRTSEEGVS